MASVDFISPMSLVFVVTICVMLAVLRARLLQKPVAWPHLPHVIVVRFHAHAIGLTLNLETVDLFSDCAVAHPDE